MPPTHREKKEDLADLSAAAKAHGRLGGQARAKSLKKSKRTAIAKQGAKARAKKLSPKERSEIARKAAKAMWAKLRQK